MLEVFYRNARQSLSPKPTCMRDAAERSQKHEKQCNLTLVQYQLIAQNQRRGGSIHWYMCLYTIGMDCLLLLNCQLGDELREVGDDVFIAGQYLEQMNALEPKLKGRMACFFTC